MHARLPRFPAALAGVFGLIACLCSMVFDPAVIEADTYRLPSALIGSHSVAQIPIWISELAENLTLKIVP